MDILQRRLQLITETIVQLVHSDNWKPVSQALTTQQAAAINPFYSNTVWTRQERKGRLKIHKPDHAHCRAATPAAKFIINSINVMLQKKHANTAKGYILFPLKHNLERTFLVNSSTNYWYEFTRKIIIYFPNIKWSAKAAKVFLIQFPKIKASNWEPGHPTLKQTLEHKLVSQFSTAQLHKYFLPNTFSVSKAIYFPRTYKQSSFQTIHSVSMATLRDSLATISRISWLWNFSIFFTSWAWSVLYTKHCQKI